MIQNVCHPGDGKEGEVMQRVEVRLKPGLADPCGQELVKEITELGISSVTDAKVHNVYYLRGKPSSDDIIKICDNALVDRVIEDYFIEPLNACNCHKAGTLAKLPIMQE